MPILNPCKPKYNHNGKTRSLFERIFIKIKNPKFSKSIYYGTLIQDGQRYVITRDHEPVPFTHLDYSRLFNSASIPTG